MTGNKSDHFTEAINVSRGRFYLASSAPLKIGTPIEVTLKVPTEVPGGEARNSNCTARVVRVKNQPCRDGRAGFGAEIERILTAEMETPRAD